MMTADDARRLIAENLKLAAEHAAKGNHAEADVYRRRVTIYTGKLEEIEAAAEADAKRGGAAHA